MIVAAGLSPAWQRTLVFDTVRPGAVNRAAETMATSGGKVVHVALALHYLGARSVAVAPLGGATGQCIREELAALGVACRWVPLEAPTRVCTTVLERSSGRMTELVENAPVMDPRRLADFLRVFREEARGARAVVLSGSLAPGAPPDFYRQMLAGVKARVVLDIRGEELLHALPLEPFLVKPNREELGRTVGRELASEAEVRLAMVELVERGAEWVVVSDGAGDVLLQGRSTGRRFHPLEVSTENPIGCGDYLAAALAWATTAGASLEQAVALGIACAAENAACLGPARLKRKRVEELAARVESEELPELP